ncbi:MAG TPA: hypothetical protein V6C81_21160 [Planktothrix sp.]|jgi:hypothetical protein
MSDELTATSVDRISLPEMADDLSCHKQTLFKIAKRMGIEPVKRRDFDRKNQLEEAHVIRQEFLSRTRASEANSDGGIGELVAEDGVFYLVQLEPEHDPGRIKVGFTTDIDGRLRKHRSSAPFAQCLKTWPCQRIWERTVIDCVTTGLEKLHTEVFRTQSIESVIAKAEQFFAIMPRVTCSIDGNGEDLG